MENLLFQQLRVSVAIVCKTLTWKQYKKTCTKSTKLERRKPLHRVSPCCLRQTVNCVRTVKHTLSVLTICLSVSTTFVFLCLLSLSLFHFQLFSQPNQSRQILSPVFFSFTSLNQGSCSLGKLRLCQLI